MGKCHFCPFFLSLSHSFLSRRYRRHGRESEIGGRRCRRFAPPRSASGLAPPRARSPETGTRRFPAVVAIARMPDRPRGCSTPPRRCRPEHAAAHARPRVRSHCWPPSALSPLSSPSLGTTLRCPVERSAAGCRVLVRATTGCHSQATVGHRQPGSAPLWVLLGVGKP